MTEIERVFVVIAVHNRIHYTQACLRSVEGQTVQGFQVVIIDDGSTDGTAEVLARDFPYVVVLSGDGNLWWPGAMNKGIQYALDMGADYVLSLNNDTELAADYIEKMMYWAERKPQALLGSVAYDITTGEIVYGGERLNWATAKSVSLLEVISADQRGPLHWVTHFPGRGLWVPREAFLRIGLLCEYWPMTHSDLDFTCRARRAGFEIYCNYDAKLYSHVEASAQWIYDNRYSLRNYIRHLTDRKSAANLKYRWVFGVRNCPPRYRVQYLILSLSRCILGYWLRWAAYLIRKAIYFLVRPESDRSGANTSGFSREVDEG